jgi:hypothetical protein
MSGSSLLGREMVAFVMSSSCPSRHFMPHTISSHRMCILSISPHPTASSLPTPTIPYGKPHPNLYDPSFNFSLTGSTTFLSAPSIALTVIWRDQTPTVLTSRRLVLAWVTWCARAS